MTVDSRQILDDYLRALELELRDLSPSDRAEIILEVREHYEEARRELADPTEADLRNIVERLGPPAEIAAEARQRLGVVIPAADPAPPAGPEAGPRPASAAGPLEIAALILWIAWLPLGVLLTALSPRWTRRVKAIAMVVQLGSLAVVLGFFVTPTYFIGHSTGMLSHLFVLPFFFLIPPTLPGIVGAAYLTWKLVSPRGRAWSAEWKLAGRIAGLVVGGWLLWVLVLGPLTFLVLKAGPGG